MNGETGDSTDTGIRIIPPLVLLAALAAAFVLDWLWPTKVGLPDVLRWVFGVPLIAAPFLIMPSVFRAFHRAGAHYDVRKSTGELVTEGAFRFTRNPGYVLGIAFCVGIGLVANNPWVVACLVPAIAVLHFGVVLREEAVLANRFGEDYLAYRRRVRRWI